MRIDRHIFGSFSGYTTLARSPGISAEEARSLESGAYAFGQSNDASVLRSLAKSPAYFTRPLGGRRGLTRVMQGRPDDNGRPTVLLITAIVSQAEWDGVLCGDISPLLEAREVWAWSGSTEIPVLDLPIGSSSSSIGRKAAPKVLALLSEVERVFNSRRPVVVSTDDYSIAEMRAVEMLIPPAVRPRFSSAFRSFSAALPVSVNCIAAEVAGAGRVNFRYAPGTPLSPYAAMLEKTGIDAGVVPSREVAAYRTFGVQEASYAAPVAAPGAAYVPPAALAPARTGVPTWSLVAAAIAAVVLAVTGFAVGNSLGFRAGELRERNKPSVEAPARSDPQALAELTARHAEALQKALNLPPGDFEQTLRAAEAKVRSAATTIAHTRGAETQPGMLSKDAREEYEQLKKFHDALARKQRERFAALRPEINQVITNLSPRKVVENAEPITRINRELQSMETHYPLLSESEAAWLKDMRVARDTFNELDTALPKIELALSQVDRLSEALEQFKQAPSIPLLSEIRKGLKPAHDAVASLPDKLPFVGTLVDFKKDQLARVDRARKWLEDWDKDKDRDKKHDKPPGPRNGRTQLRTRDAVSGGVAVAWASTLGRAGSEACATRGAT